MSLRLAVLSVCAAATATTALAGDYDAPLRDLAESQLGAWIANGTLTSAIAAQNERHAGLSEDDIIDLDNQWRAGVDAGGSDLISEVLARPSSQLLIELQEGSEGLVTEVFIMDNRGLNVAQSGITSDLWQGDEAKWQETFAKGAGAIHFGDVEFDESTQSYQTQLSMAITDPSSGDVIGAVTFGIDVGYLE